MNVDKLLSTVIKAAVAAIAVTAAAKIVAPAFARWQRKRELQREHARLQAELEMEQLRSQANRIGEIFELADRLRAQVGLKPPGDGSPAN